MRGGSVPILLAAIVVASVLPGVDARAQGGGLNLGWDDCGGLPPTLNRTFACDTNSGTHTLVGSFVAPSQLTAVTSIAADLHGQSTGASWPGWWNIRAGGCRAAATMQSNFNFTGGPGTCFDYWQGAALGGNSMNAPTGNRTRIGVLAMLPTGSPRIGPITQGTEVYAFKLIFDNARTVGPGACAGCQTGVCIVLNSINVVQTQGSPGGNKFVTAPATRSHVTWQGGIAIDCYAATPAKDATWGSIKSLYR